MRALKALRSDILVAAEFGPYEDSEITLSGFLWRAVPDDALVMVDRGFLAAGIPGLYLAMRSLCSAVRNSLASEGRSPQNPPL